MLMEKKSWVAPTVTQLTSAKDAQLGNAGARDLLGRQLAGS
jgi:hypothetical protein